MRTLCAVLAVFLATNVSAQPRRPAAPAKAPPAKAAPAAPRPAAPAVPDLRALDPENALLIETTKGPILVELSPLAAPGHVERIKTLTRRGFYDGIVFHRVIEGFMAQTGDPQGTGEGGSDLPDLVAEFSFRRGADTPFALVNPSPGAEIGFVGALPVQSQPADMMALTADGKVTAFGLYCPGVLGAARVAEPDTANSQFFLMRATYPSLNGRYTAFGRVVSGMEVVKALKTGEPVVDPDRMVRVRVLADVPEAERPKVRLLDPRGPTFRARLQAARQAKGPAFNVCDLDLTAP